MHLRSLGAIALLLVAACRGAAPGEGGADQVARSDSALTARTWGLAYLQQNQLPQAALKEGQPVDLKVLEVDPIHHRIVLAATGYPPEAAQPEGETKADAPSS